MADSKSNDDAGGDWDFGGIEICISRRDGLAPLRVFWPRLIVFARGPRHIVIIGRTPDAPPVLETQNICGAAERASTALRVARSFDDNAAGR